MDEEELKNTTLILCKSFIEKSLEILRAEGDRSLFSSVRTAIRTEAASEQQLVDYLLSQDNIKSLYQTQTNISAAIKSFLGRYLLEAQDFKFKATLFINIFRAFWREINEAFCEWKFVAPIYKLQVMNETEIGGIKLVPVPSSGPIMQIKKIVKKHLAYNGPVDQIDLFDPQGSLPILPSTICVYSIKTPKQPDFYSFIMGGHPSDALKPLHRLMTCLRLLKTGAISANWSYVYQVSFRSYSLSKLFELLPIQYFGKDYSLSAKEARWAKRLMTKLDTYTESSGKDNSIELALDYFNSSYSKIRARDKFIDLMVAMDALYGIGSELSYRLSLRVSFLLGRDELSIRSIYENMKQIYSLRSRIVHGGRRQPNEKHLETFTSLLEEYVRATLCCFIGLFLERRDLASLLEKFEEEVIISRTAKARLLQATINPHSETI